MVMPRISYLGKDPETVNRLNACAYQQSALTTAFGFQYAAFYTEKAPHSSRLVTLARRQIDDSSLQSWQYLIFQDYEQTTDDGHNTISIGICSTDASIHVAFDHHTDPLKYRVSRPNLAKDASQEGWVAENFSPVCNRLPCVADVADDIMDMVTYPRFIDADGRMFLEYRVGKAGAGSDVLFVYEPSLRKFHFLGTYLVGNGCNPYINGISYNRNLQSLHVTWTNRHFIEYEGARDRHSTAHKAQAGPNGPENNEGLYHAASDVSNISWGSFTDDAAIVDSSDAASSMESQDTRLRAKDIPRNSGIMNQEAQYMDENGSIHVLNRENTSGQEQWYHYYGNSTQGWRWFALPQVYPTATGPRGKLVYFSEKDAAFYVLPSNTSDELIIARAEDVVGEKPMKFTVIWKDSGYAGEPLINEAMLRDHGRLSVLINKQADDNERKIAVLDFNVDDLFK